MIELKRKDNNIFYNIENAHPLKWIDSSPGCEVLTPSVPMNPNNVPFARWCEKHRCNVEEIKGYFLSILQDLPSDYSVRINSKNLEHDLEQMIYKFSSNRRKSFI
jgi:hypothetical protein